MYYKVVTKIDDKLVSAFVYDTALCQEYKIGEFVFAKSGFPFMIFNDIEYALNFKEIMASYRDSKLYTCSVVNPKDYHPKVIGEIKTNFYRDQINYDLLNRNGKSYKDIPRKINGTYFCEGLALNELVD